MKPIRYLGVALLLLAGCQGMPTVTRSGDVKDIIVGDNITSGEVAVGPGDEVRWVNKRTAPVRIVFLDPMSDKQLSCKNNFGGLMTHYEFNPTPLKGWPTDQNSSGLKIGYGSNRVRAKDLGRTTPQRIWVNHGQTQIRSSALPDWSIGERDPGCRDQ